MELTLVDYKLSRMPPSIIAAASLYLAGKVLENAEWTDTLVYYSTYTEQSLMPVVKSIAKLIAKADVSKFQVCSFNLICYVPIYIPLQEQGM